MEKSLQGYDGLTLHVSFLTEVLGLPEKADILELMESMEVKGNRFEEYRLLFTHNGLKFYTSYSVCVSDDEYKFESSSEQWKDSVENGYVEYFPILSEAKRIDKSNLKWRAFLEKIEDLKDNYNTKELPLAAGGFQTLLMSGAMDSLFDEYLTLDKRYEKLEELKKALKSKAKLSEGKGEEIGLAKVTNELTRNIWMAQVNPMYQFSMASFYSSALKAMRFVKVRDSGITHESDDTDLVASFADLFDDKIVDFYGNYNCERLLGFIAIYEGQTMKTCSNGKQKRDVKLFDGTTRFNATVWPMRNSNDKFDQGIMMRLKEKDRPLLVIGRPSKKNGYSNFTISSLLDFEL
jgi:hypothetical protein